MLLWIILAFLTAAVAAAFIIPLARSARAAAASAADDRANPDNRAGEVEVYRDQLGELQRDLAGGLIGTEEAEYAKAEIGRRLLAAAASGEKTGGKKAPEIGRHRLAIAVATVVPPAIGLCLYVMLGSPGLPDQPLEARLANPGNDMALLVTKAEQHLAQNPQDGAGWDLLAPIYFRTQRLGDADLAYRNAIRILGESVERLNGLGETVVAENQGVVTDDARTAFQQAAKLQPNEPRSSFYLALALEQAGKAPEARAAFETLAKVSPPGAPWLPLVSQHIEKNGGMPLAAAKPAPPALGSPTQEDVAAAQNMSSGDRQEMIRGMIDTLAAKLTDDPNNLEGWLRLVRSYAVLGDKPKAEAALATGLKQFPASGDEGRQLVALAGQMGLAVAPVAKE
ncbi:MAG: c-type cytochrome biogenesis protein CcmI [Neorhizobium sp.]|nr:c-type cytochrome biogenesis protein CcmI [Neorhizobium sp.]